MARITSNTSDCVAKIKCITIFIIIYLNTKLTHAQSTQCVPLGVDVNLQKWNARLEEEVLPWDFVSRAAFQLGAANPRHKITSGYNEGLTDVVRDFMDLINKLDFHCFYKSFIS